MPSIRRSGARGRDVEQVGYPFWPLSVLAFWDPESMNHYSGILSVGSGEGWSVLQH